MDTLKLIGSTIFLILMLSFLAETQISLSPFEIKFKKGLFMIGFMLIVIGCYIIRYEAKREGMRQMRDSINELLDNYRKDLTKPN